MLSTEVPAWIQSFAAKREATSAESKVIRDPVESCAAWPGEPAPLPRISDSDPVLARWAELRAAELTRHAEVAEPSDRPEGHRLWRRVLCLDPGSQAAQRGLARSHPVRVHRPAILSAPPATPGEALDPWRTLGAPLLVTGEAP